MPNIFDFNPINVNPFAYWKWNKVLPAVYDDSLSQYEILCKLLDTVNTIISSTNSTGEQVEQLTQLVQQLIDGQFPSGIVQYVTDIVKAIKDEDIDAINSRIAALETLVNSYNQTLHAQIDSVNQSLQGKINSTSQSLQGQINSVNQSLQGQINSIASRYQGGDIVIIGDSYDEPYSPDFTDGVSWSTRLKNTLSASHINVYNAHLGGSGVATGSRTFAQQLTNLAATMTEAQRNRVSTIVFYGGYNDHSATGAEVSRGMEAFANACTANFKNASRIIGAFVGRCVTGKTTGVHANTQFASVQNALNNWILAAWASPRCIAIANGIQVLCSNGDFSSDFVHPSKSGLNHIASFMNSVVFGVPCANTYNVADNTGILPTSNYTVGGNQIVITSEPYGPQGTQHRMVSITVTVNWSTPVSHTFGVSPTFEFDLAPCSALMGCYIYGTCLAVVKYNNRFYEAPAAWRINDTKLIVKVTLTNSDHTNYLTANVQELQLVTA